MELNIFSPAEQPDGPVKDRIINFLFVNLQEYGDKKPAIRKCLDYALSNEKGKGGFVVVSTADKETITGAVIVNRTGMSDYIPENILVYIATHQKFRGQGIGKQLMEATLGEAKGDIALHVEKNNPAIHLYEKYGFTTPYLEMRLKR